MSEEIKEILWGCEKQLNEASGYNDTTNKILDYIERLESQLQQKENIIKEVRETLNNKRTIMTTQLLNGGYCNYKELLYQVDEEIRKILDKVGDSNE